MLRRLALTAVASFAVLSAAAPAATAATGPLPLLSLPLPLPSALQGDDGTGKTRLTVTVSDSGDREADGVYELRCLPAAAPSGGAAGLRPAGGARAAHGQGGRHGPLPSGARGRHVHPAVRRLGHGPGHRDLAGAARRRVLRPDRRLRDRPLEHAPSGAPQRPLTRAAELVSEPVPGASQDSHRAGVVHRMHRTLVRAPPHPPSDAPPLPLDSSSDSLRPEGQDGARCRQGAVIREEASS